MTYEIIREIFNLCRNNQMRDVFIEEREIDSPEDYMRSFFDGKEVEMEKTVREDGTVIYDVSADGLRQRFRFSP